MRLCLLLAQLGILILLGFTRWEMQGLKNLLDANAGVKYSVATEFVVITGESFDVREVKR